MDTQVLSECLLANCPLRVAMYTHKALGLSPPIAESNYGV